MRKETWWTITYKTKRHEEVVGFKQAVLFRERQYAVEEYKKGGYSKVDKRKGMKGGWRIKKCTVSF